MKKYDFVIAGGGIVGLTLARELARRKSGSVLVLEKEPTLGAHASGRNSGILHAGLYYAPGSLKAKVCVRGAALMRDYAKEHGIPFSQSGKVLVARSPEEHAVLKVLLERAHANGAKAEMIDERHLAELEPEARTFEKALWSPETSVIDPLRVLKTIEEEILSLGVSLLKSEPVVGINANSRVVRTDKNNYEYGHLINAAGLHADRMAHQMGIGERYRILPFKGVYRKMVPEIGQRFRGSIYPAPDLNMPFLGVHLTRSVHGDVYAGPTALPAFGRENYGRTDGLGFPESLAIAAYLARMFGANSSNFRNFVWEEIPKYTAGGFMASVQTLAPSLHEKDFAPGVAKVGLRAQLVDRQNLTLVMDFIIEKGPHSTHILNAISPAFTASFAFAELACDRLMSRD